MKFFAALKTAEFAAKVSSAAGFDLDAAIKGGNENALKDFIAAQVSAAVTTASKPATDAAAQIATLDTALASATDTNATLAQQNEVLLGTLTAAGVTLPKAADASTTADQIAANKAALDAHIKVRAQGILAQTGHPALASVAEDAKPTGRAAVEAKINASLAKLKAARS